LSRFTHKTPLLCVKRDKGSPPPRPPSLPTKPSITVKTKAELSALLLTTETQLQEATKRGLNAEGAIF
jgi:hypothetical protein